MDAYASKHLYSERQVADYMNQKHACVEVGRAYMRGEMEATGVILFLRELTQRYASQDTRMPKDSYAGYSRYLRLVSVGCWLAKRDGSALPQRMGHTGHAGDIRGASAPQLGDTERTNT